MVQLTNEQLQTLEDEIEQTLYQLIDLVCDEAYQKMTTCFAQLLTKMQAAHLIDNKLNVLVEPQVYTTETCILLESLLEAQNRPYKRQQLLTHRMILNIWLRKKRHIAKDLFPQLF